MVNWRDLDVSDGEHSIGTLGEVLDNASDAGIERIELDGDGIAAWQGRYLAAMGEEPDWDTPRVPTDWSGFPEALADAITRL